MSEEEEFKNGDTLSFFLLTFWETDTAYIWR